MYKIVIILLNVLLFILVFLSILIIRSIVKEQTVVDKLVETFEDRYKQRMVEEKNRRKLEGNVKKRNLFNHIDDMLVMSGMSRVLPFMNTDLYIIMVVSCAIACFIVVSIIFKFWAFSLLASVFVIFIGYFILYYLSGVAYEKIDDSLIGFINNIESFSATSSDIVTIIEGVIPFTEQPLSRLLSDFVATAKSSGDTQEAFNSLERRIENEKIRTLIKNLDMASRHNANYSEIITEARTIFDGYFKAKTSRKIIVSNGRVGIAMILGLGVIMLLTVNKFINGLLFFYLQNSFIGNLIILVGIVIVAWALWLFLIMDRG